MSAFYMNRGALAIGMLFVVASAFFWWVMIWQPSGIVILSPVEVA
jgi:hypothetical protein